MKLVKLMAVLFAGIIAVIGLTLAWILRIQAKIGGGAVDIIYVATRPWFFLELALIVAVAGFVCWRWAL